MTLRRDKKKESLTRKMLEHERAATAALVEKQSHEMMELIQERRSEYMAASSLFVDGEEAPPYPARAPPPQPPLVSKFHIYTDPAEFADVDKIAISVAQEDQKTFTDLVRQLVGYQPGVRFEDNRFRNSWNAVFVAGAWRFVQCNWGARHLVNAKDAPKPGNRGKSDSLRYEYDDHYFLTDPREFIYEFFPLQPDWQLLKTPITLHDFEELPFVRSLFFRYGLYFSDPNTKAVMFTDSTAMPAHMQSSLIFHYNLKFYDTEGDGFDGVSLKRFVMQSVVGNVVSFRVHAPCSGAFLLDIFANAVTPREYLTGEPMKFKSVCKFKEALVFAGRELEIQFRMSRPLADFMATLHKNGVDEKRLSKYVQQNVSDDIVSFYITFPEEAE
ncbi:unnamed protein product [Spodoptera littoralis]|uniref:KY-like immunoglobulin-like domain-containing protein n=1 Tax=Spodoptera littoralis TaxID=7109 RepID=A0A9P0I3J3_SPOLI|nr:unnamed protein product [Spodoptera littoralis]CAH1640438.1 unnamed protein product [Spodoptera littoralis]